MGQKKTLFAASAADRGLAPQIGWMKQKVAILNGGREMGNLIFRLGSFFSFG